MTETRERIQSTDFDRYRLTVSKSFIGLLWLLGFVLPAIAWRDRIDPLTVAAAAAALAISSTVAYIFGGNGVWPRMVIAAALTGEAGLFVYAGAGAWQSDYHLAFFAVIAMLAAYADWRPIALAAVLVPLHHVALGRVFRHAPVDAGDPARLVLQVAFTACESLFLIWLTSRIEMWVARALSPEGTLLDPLTSLPNDRAYKRDLGAELKSLNPESGTLVLALIDVDDFKAFNDTQGAAHGDRALRAIAGRLQRGRGSERAYRLGGDDFALLLPGARLEEAVAAARYLQREGAGRPMGTTISVGLACGDASFSPHLLHDQAEMALYEAKRRGCNAVVSYSELGGAAAVVHSAKADALRHLIEQGTMDIAFQPIWNLGEDELLGFEALARPALRFGFTGPQDAFDVAEALHLEAELDTVCRNAAIARANELPARALLFVNVSPTTLERHLLPARTLADAVLAAGVTLDRIVLEITERASAHVGTMIDEATRLRGLGFKLALDDTGKGNAGLEMLAQMTVDFVKIDGEVCAKVCTQRSARGVFSGIVAIARETGACLIAEGIEDAQILASILPSQAQGEGGVAALQGYLIGRPSLVVPEEHAVGRYQSAIRRRLGAPQRASAIERLA